MKAWLEDLEGIVAAYERQVEEADRAVELAQSRLKGAQGHLDIAKHFLDMERERLAAESPPRRLSLKDACTRAVQEKGRANNKEIMDWLIGHGINLKTEYPSRAIHAALMHSKGIKRVAPGTYEAV